MTQGRTTPSSDLKDPMPTAGAGPLNIPGVAWAQEDCSFAQVYKAVTGTRIADRKNDKGDKVGRECGVVKAPGTACLHCRETPSFTVPFEMTREIPPSVFESNRQQLSLRSFPTPSGARLLIFSSLEEAKQSPWKEEENPFQTGYVVLTQQGAKIVQIQCCPNCHRAHLTAGEGIDPALFCTKLTKSNTMTPETAALGPIKFVHPQHHGQPGPNCFVFGKDRFPVRIILPDTVLIKADQEGKAILDEYKRHQYYSAAEIVVFFDDSMMPYGVTDDNRVYVEMNARPFERVYRPTQFDLLCMKVMVYLNNGKTPLPGIDLRYNRYPIPVLPAGSTEQPVVLYSENFIVFMSKEKQQEHTYFADENRLHPRGTNAKKRFPTIEHLRLNMELNDQNALFQLAVNYLQGGFLADEKAREQIISARNAGFTQALSLPIEGEDNRKQKIDWFNEMLNEVTSYYLRHCKHLDTFREGLIQLLDFSHGLNNQDNFISILTYVRNLRVRAITQVLQEDKSTFQEIQKRVQELKEIRLKKTPIENPAQEKALDWEINREVICQFLASNSALCNAVYQKLPADVLNIPAEGDCAFQFNRMVAGKVQLVVVTVAPDNQLKETIYPNEEAWEADCAAKDSPSGDLKDSPPPRAEKKQAAPANGTISKQPTLLRPNSVPVAGPALGPDKTLAAERRKSF